MGKLRALWEKGKFALPVLGLGVLLLLWPGGEGRTEVSSSEPTAEETAAAQQKEMERILSRIEGTGELHLMLTLESDGQRTLAENAEESVSGSAEAPESQSRRETVILSEQPLDEAALRAAIDATGYKVLSMTAHPYEKKGMFAFLKK